ncbi:MAG TPA: hypothetical protein DCF62_09175 [Porticoccaceae bacterium]|nr:hypothetical protein [Porticoccaceae bacterium]HCO60343.1 hypothetical protein [Porticoccaceae bacterium]
MVYSAYPNTPNPPPEIIPRKRAVKTGLIRGVAVGLTLTTLAVSGIALAEDAGKKDYMTYCASCHGDTGEGNGPVAGSLQNRPPDLTFLHQQETDGAFPRKLVKGIIEGNPDYDKNFRTHGPSDMPVWGKILYEDSGERSSIAEARINHLVDYIESLQK